MVGTSSMRTFESVAFVKLQIIHLLNLNLKCNVPLTRVRPLANTGLLSCGLSKLPGDFGNVRVQSGGLHPPLGGLHPPHSGVFTPPHIWRHSLAVHLQHPSLNITTCLLYGNYFFIFLEFWVTFDVSSYTKFQIPGPCWGSLRRSPNPLANGEGLAAHLPKNPPPALPVTHTTLMLLPG